MSKQKIAVVAGGFSGESVISMKSAQMIMDNIDRSIFEPMLFVIDKQGWNAHTESGIIPINRGDFSVDLAQGKWVCDKAFVIIHGKPGEDGVLQGYFELLGIKHTTGDVFNMSSTFNKTATNSLLASYGFNTAQDVMIRKDDHYSTSEIVSRLGLPVFVKPNQGGSSLATSKIHVKEGLHAAIDAAFHVNNEVIIETFVEGRELTCGVIEIEGEPTALPVTEIITEHEFFDYTAKYEGQSQEITPAAIDDELKNKIQSHSVSIYKMLNCKGMIRVDFLASDVNNPHIIEVNTVPGFTQQSLIPQQAVALGMSVQDLISHIIGSC